MEAERATVFLVKSISVSVLRLAPIPENRVFLSYLKQFNINLENYNEC